MEDETSNLEWKKNKGFDETEKLTRKTNVKKALQFEAKQKKPVNAAFTPLPTDLPKGLKKIRKKIIRDAYDEDEEEDEIFTFLPPEQNNSTLLNALHDDEKRQLKQQDTIKTMSMQQTAGKMEALTMANQTSRQLGLKGLKAATINTSMQDATLTADTYQQAIKDDIARKLKLNGRRLSEGETVMMLRGIERIRNMAAASDESQAKALEGLKLDKIIEYGDPGKKTDQQVAEEILTKTGRKEDSKKTAKKAGKNRSKNKDLKISKDMLRD